jgi:PAS domain-containing protein
MMPPVHPRVPRKRGEGDPAGRLGYAAIVVSSYDAIISKNADGVILAWNAVARRMFG